MKWLNNGLIILGVLLALLTFLSNWMCFGTGCGMDLKIWLPIVIIMIILGLGLKILKK